MQGPARAETVGVPADLPAHSDRARRLPSLPVFGLNAAAAVLSFVGTLVLAAALGPDEYGRSALVLGVLVFLSFVFDFGYFSAAARLLATTDDEVDQRHLIGAMLLVFGVVSALFVATALALSPLAGVVFSGEVGSVLARVAVLCPAMLLPFFLEQILKGIGRILVFSVWQAVGKVLYLGAAVALAVRGEVTATQAVLAYLVTSLVAVVVVVRAVHPLVGGCRPHFDRIRAEHRAFGRALYAGRTANLTTYRTDTLLIGAFHSSRAVGFYALAMAIASVVPMFSQALVSSQFRALARGHRLPRDLRRTNLAGIGALVILALAAGHFVVVERLGDGFADVSAVLLPALLATGLQAAYQPFNAWLLANGAGRRLRTLLLVVTAVNLVANVALIPPFGAVGAAAASAVSMAAYLLLSMSHYRRHLTMRAT